MSKTYLEGAVSVSTFAGPQLPFKKRRRFVQITSNAGYIGFHEDELPAVIAALERIEKERPR